MDDKGSKEDDNVKDDKIIDDHEKFDHVIEDLYQEPIKLRRPSKTGDKVDAKNEAAPSLPPKIRNVDVVPAFREASSSAFDNSETMNAGNILTMDNQKKQKEVREDKDVSVHDLLGKNEVEVHQSATSESIKAFFGDKDTVDAGREAGPSYEYNMKHKARGCFLIFNHMYFLPHLGVNSRKGTHEDAKNLEKTAKKLGFEYVRIFDDLNVKDIRSWVARVSKADHSNYDCFAMAILTHGDEGDILYAHDEKYHLDDITEPFMASNCPTLARKPKMFFIQNEFSCDYSYKMPCKKFTQQIQLSNADFLLFNSALLAEACRGVMLDDGAHTTGDTVDAVINKVSNQAQQEAMIIPNAADFLLAFSTVPGYYAWRNQACGSWFIQALCKCLLEFGDRLELMQIMTRVNRMVAYDFTSYSKGNPDFHGKKQIPSIVTRLTHEVFFRKKGKRSPSPLRQKHKEPAIEAKQLTLDGKMLSSEDKQNKVPHLKGLKETDL
ncbi:caspase-3-like isoform X2 [Styela clava]|uniref:caspase-7-like isoform X2 n=1 Tax=Styela clava TaxID=7725 RepID=UPI00193996C0|nr:caspase-7-like isoform X2 [Styela clava]